MPIQWLHSDAALCHEAARLKAAHKISFADAFVAATATRFDGTLVHKDPNSARSLARSSSTFCRQSPVSPAREGRFIWDTAEHRPHAAWG